MKLGTLLHPKRRSFHHLHPKATVVLATPQTHRTEARLVENRVAAKATGTVAAPSGSRRIQMKALMLHMAPIVDGTIEGMDLDRTSGSRSRVQAVRVDAKSSCCLW